MVTIKSLQLALADEQGKLFELSKEMGYDSEVFIREFMQSNIAKDLDSDFNHMQWAGKAYIMERIQDELTDKITQDNDIYEREVLYWMGYVYRCWHYYIGETCKEIYRQASAKTMKATYLAYHTLDIEMAIDRLKETYREKHLK